MLLNGVHLLPDPSGAVICPRQRLMALADPLEERDDRERAQVLGPLVRRLTSLLRQRPALTVLWLGQALPTLLARDGGSSRPAAELIRMIQDRRWIWVGETAATDLGETAPFWTAEGLTFRAQAEDAAEIGEIAAAPAPLATTDGITAPCYLTDGRRMILPAFGPALIGTDVLAAPFQSLFRRPFTALLLAPDRIITRRRDQLEQAGRDRAAAPPPRRALGRRMSLLGGNGED